VGTCLPAACSAVEAPLGGLGCHSPGRYLPVLVHFYWSLHLPAFYYHYCTTTCSAGTLGSAVSLQMPAVFTTLLEVYWPLVHYLNFYHPAPGGGEFRFYLPAFLECSVLHCLHSHCLEATATDGTACCSALHLPLHFLCHRPTTTTAFTALGVYTILSCSLYHSFTFVLRPGSYYATVVLQMEFLPVVILFLEFCSVLPFPTVLQFLHVRSATILGTTAYYWNFCVLHLHSAPALLRYVHLLPGCWFPAGWAWVPLPFHCILYMVLTAAASAALFLFCLLPFCFLPFPFCSLLIHHRSVLCSALPGCILLQCTLLWSSVHRCSTIPAFTGCSLPTWNSVSFCRSTYHCCSCISANYCGPCSGRFCSFLHHCSRAPACTGGVLDFLLPLSLFRYHHHSILPAFLPFLFYWEFCLFLFLCSWVYHLCSCSTGIFLPFYCSTSGRPAISDRFRSSPFFFSVLFYLPADGCSPAPPISFYRCGISG